ncbi:MAG: hypothetical protein WCO28_12570 [Bacteroidota bacterium]
MNPINTIFGISSIGKEEISEIQFVSEEVLASVDQINNRRSELQKAMLLGNSEKSKSKIVFATNNGLRKVETTVWAVDDLDVVLKAGVFIPIHAICHVALL